MPVGSSPNAVAATRDGLRAYVANMLDGSVTVVDAPGATAITTVPVGGNPSGIAVTNDGAKVYVTTGADVVVIDTASTSLMTAGLAALYPALCP